MKACFNDDVDDMKAGMKACFEAGMGACFEVGMRACFELIIELATKLVS